MGDIFAYGLPIRHRRVENLICKVFHHFVNQGFLDSTKLLVGIILGSGGKLFLPAFISLDIAETNVDCHSQLLE